MTVGGYLLVPRLVRMIARLNSPETLLVASVGLCFAFALLAREAGYSVALGAFLSFLALCLMLALFVFFVYRHESAERREREKEEEREYRQRWSTPKER